mmetsp:Transcript_4162/g.9209  ORF Transcript_4162/g.9209 Transcript_4162/m.9209 type:complete len:286 (-) Transcript_4162:436-1293(-)
MGVDPHDLASAQPPPEPALPGEAPAVVNRSSPVALLEEHRQQLVRDALLEPGQDVVDQLDAPAVSRTRRLDELVLIPYHDAGPGLPPRGGVAVGAVDGGALLERVGGRLGGDVDALDLDLGRRGLALPILPRRRAGSGDLGPVRVVRRGGGRQLLPRGGDPPLRLDVGVPRVVLLRHLGVEPRQVERASVSVGRLVHVPQREQGEVVPGPVPVDFLLLDHREQGFLVGLRQRVGVVLAVGGLAVENSDVVRARAAGGLGWLGHGAEGVEDVRRRGAQLVFNLRDD